MAEQMEKAYMVPEGEGQSIWFLGTLMTVKASAEDTRGAFTLIEQVLPSGFSPPPHLHRSEDEAFYILEGAMSVTCGDNRWKAGAGSFIFLPRGIVHWFNVESAGQAKVLQFTAPAGFERFALELGGPVNGQALPPPAEPDVQKLREAAAKYGYEILRSPTFH